MKPENLADRVLRQTCVALFFAFCTAAGAGLYREDAFAAVWIILAVALDLVHAELRRLSNSRGENG